MNHQIRLSRISHPRASLLGVALLIAVFAGFGLWAEVFHPEWMQLSSLEASSSVSHAVADASTGQHLLQKVLVAFN